MRRPARLLPLIALLLLLAIGTLVLLRTGPLANYVRALIATELSKQLDRDVTIAGAGVTSSGEIALDDLLVRNEDGTSLLRVPRVSVRMGTGRGFLSLFSGATEIRSVRLVDPELALTRLPDGKLSVSDLLERPREAPSRFRGSVEVEGGKITLVDQASDGLTTSLSDVRVSFAYPRPDTAVFAVECGRNDGILDSLELRGERSTESGETRVQFLAKGVVAPYVLERLPDSGLGDVSAGEADLKGEVSFGSEHGALSYDVLMQLSQVEIAFPWLRQPVQQVEGEVRVRDGGVDLRRLVGTLADAPVTVDGSILSVDEPTLDLKITASGVRYRQIQALFPRVALPAALVLPSPLGVTADVKGPVTDIRVTGEARMSVIEFRAVPWHDLVMPFEYRRGRLRVSPSAHGSPRRFEAELEVDLLKPMPGGAGTVSVMNLPLEMLAAMAGIEGDFGGTVQAKVRGEVDGDRRFSGSVRVVDAVIQGAAIGELEGDFEYADDVLLFPELRLSGPVATGVLEAKYSRAGDYELRGSLTQLDLSAIGASVSLAALRGRCCAHLEASGHLGDGTAGGSVLLGPGEIQGRDFESLSATFSVSPTRAALAQLELRLGRGQCAGGIAVGGWKGPREQAEVSGRLEFSGFGLDEWLPPQVSVVAPSGRVSGSVELGGTLADPGVAVDLRLESLTGAGQAFDGGEIQARYEHGRLIVEKGRVGIADGDLFVTGGYAPETGFSLQLVSDNIQLEQLAAGWRTQLGLALTGTLAATASLTGPLERPKLAVSLAARPLSLNQEQFDELVLDARFEGSTFGIDSFELQQGESSVSLFGTFDTEDESVVAELKLTELDIGALAMIANSAIYRLDRTRGDRPRPRFVQSYARVVSHLTRRPKGSLSAVVSVSGTIAEPQIEVASLAFDDAAFDGWRVDHVGGSLSISLGKRPSGAARSGDWRWTWRAAMAVPERRS